MKRKTQQIIKEMNANTQSFPANVSHDYWHLPLPAADDFMTSNRTPKKIKRLCIQTLLNRAEHLIDLKQNDGEIYRVVVAVDLPELWHSQIIVFKGNSYVKNFFNRQDEHQTWLPLSDQRNIQKEWDLSVPQNMRSIGFKEVITDDDEVSYEGERWFMGELDDIK
ncbi:MULTISPECIES: DUF3916 domain-containing protein [Bacillus]|uniref:DUF3916 domain-containing protein n=1 Tax=Bacillus TaxID=1386 RepID=UPI002942561B|nr:DUF3916 domain-containing protein [Bacillus altitudinis]WOI42016.1 DUF3916 domain-containing protein [Bacillus altitudinis]